MKNEMIPQVCSYHVP